MYKVYKNPPRLVTSAVGLVGWLLVGVVTSFSLLVQTQLRSNSSGSLPLVRAESQSRSTVFVDLWCVYTEPQHSGVRELIFYLISDDEKSILFFFHRRTNNYVNFRLVPTVIRCDSLLLTLFSNNVGRIFFILFMCVNVNCMLTYFECDQCEMLIATRT